tara:strand:- start:1007 stop:1264 length:258 start_codon:yes stop_codon:yes gene_type:complete
MMTPELKAYMMALMLPSYIDDMKKLPMTPKTRQSFLRVTQFCEELANKSADSFHKHDSLKDKHDIMVNEWCRYIDNYDINGVKSK